MRELMPRGQRESGGGIHATSGPHFDRCLYKGSKLFFTCFLIGRRFLFCFIILSSCPASAPPSLPTYGLVGMHACPPACVPGIKALPGMLIRYDFATIVRRRGVFQRESNRKCNYFCHPFRVECSFTVTVSFGAGGGPEVRKSVLRSPSDTPKSGSPALAHGSVAGDCSERTKPAI